MTSKDKQYDDTAEYYNQWVKSPLREYAWKETVTRCLGDLTGKRVLDLACGTGVSTKIISDLGARSILGLDISERSIQIAKKLNLPNAKYCIGDAFDFGYDHLGEFDVAVAFFLIEYSNSEVKIRGLIEKLKTVITDGGSLYFVTVNPEVIEPTENYYGIRQPQKPAFDGEEYVDYLNTSTDNPIEFPVRMYYWNKQKIDAIFQDNGLVCQWKNVYVSRSGIDKFGQDYWKMFLSRPIYLIAEVKFN